MKISDELLHYSVWGHDRKDQHVMLASQQYSRESAPDFEATRFVHQSLPQLKVEDVDYSTSIAGLDLQAPFFINAMTGGTEETGRINRVLGILGFLAKIPVASGSVSAAIKDPSVAETFSFHLSSLSVADAANASPIFHLVRDLLPVSKTSNSHLL